jgi:hypothetical protein
MSIMRFVENKVTGQSERPSEGLVQVLFNRFGACLLCGHTPVTGACCACEDCVCCTKRGIVRPEEL